MTQQRKAPKLPQITYTPTVITAKNIIYKTVKKKYKQLAKKNAEDKNVEKQN